MDINIKTLQVTAMEAAVKVDVNTTPPIQKEISALQIQPVSVIEMIGDVDSSTAPLVQKASFATSPTREPDSSRYD